MDAEALLIQTLNENTNATKKTSEHMTSLRDEIRTFYQTVEIWLEKHDKLQREHVAFLQGQSKNLISFQQTVTVNAIKWALGLSGWIIAGGMYAKMAGWW